MTEKVKDAVDTNDSQSTHGGFWSHVTVTVLMGLIVATVLTWSPVLFGIALTPERLSLLLQDEAQRRSLPIASQDNLPQIQVLDMSLLTGPDRRLVSRSEVARVISSLDAAGAKVILLDINLSRPSPEDSKLAAVLSALRHAQVILPVNLAPRSSMLCTARTDLNERLEEGLDQAFWPLADQKGLMPRVWYGHVETDADIDGVFRSVCPFVSAYVQQAEIDGRARAVAIPSVALLTAVLASQSARKDERAHWQAVLRAPAPIRGLVEIRSDALGESDFVPRRIHFLGKGASYNDTFPPVPRVSLLPREMLEGEADRSNLRGAVVLVGSSSSLTGDQSQTPLKTMPGLFVVANLIANFADDRFLTKPTGHFAHFLFECLFVTFGSIVFVLLYDGLALLLGRTRWGKQAHHNSVTRGCAVLIKALWLITLSWLLGWTLIDVQAWLSAHSVAANVAVDPAVGVVAILAERIIHIANALEGRLRVQVRVFVDHIFQRRPATESLEPIQPVRKARSEEISSR